MSLSKKNKQLLHILVLLTLAGPISKAMVAIVAGAYVDVAISLGLFILFAALYWFFGIDYFEVHHWFGIEEKEKNKQANVPKIILHFLALLTIISSFLLAIVMVVNEAYLKMGLFLALFAILGILCFVFGIDSFGIHHLFGLRKKGENN